MAGRDKSIAPKLKAALLDRLGLFWGHMAYWAFCVVVMGAFLLAIALMFDTLAHPGPP
jgi:hypothetical protein